MSLVPVGHPGRNVTVYDEESWKESLSKPLCAEENCLDWGEPVVICGEEVSVDPVRGHVWYQNGYMDSAFPVHLRVYCFHCAFWHEVLENFNEGTVVTEHPSHDDQTEIQVHQFNWEEPIVSRDSSSFRGYGGRLFKIEFTDGRDSSIVKTNNLWHRGVVPTWFRDRFTVNARFLES